MHYKPLVERKAHIQKLLKKLNLDSEFILQFDREEITELYKKYNLNKEKWNHQLKLTKSIFLNNKLIDTNEPYRTKKRQLLYLFNKFYTPNWMRPRKLTLSEFSLYLKHDLALKKISNLSTPALVIEDDVVLKPTTNKLIEKSYQLCKEEFDYIDLGGGCNLPLFEEDTPLSNNKEFVKLKIPRSRTTAAYMLNSRAARILSKGIHPIIMPVDWQYQYLFLKNKFNVAWTNPSAFSHGSENEFKTSLTRN